MSDTPNYYLNWDEFHRDTRALATALLQRREALQRGGQWRGIIGIARGGLIPAAIIGRELNIRLIDSLCIASYDHNNQGDANILKGIDGDGEGWLVIDDLVDTGNTAKLVREILPKATIATVYAKPKGRALADIFIREFEQDVWIHFPWDITHTYSEPMVTGRDLVP